MDKLQSDIDYYTVRLIDTERQALTAMTDTARSSYGELASLYRARLEELRGTTSGPAGLASLDEGS